MFWRCLALIGACNSLFHKKIKLRDPSCDVSCKSRNVQDGGQLNISSQNVSRNKADKNSVIDVCILFLSILLYSVFDFKFLSMKIFVAICLIISLQVVVSTVYEQEKIFAHWD